MFENGTWRIQISLSIVDLLSGFVGLMCSVVFIFFEKTRLAISILEGGTCILTLLSLQHLLIIAFERYIAVTDINVSVLSFVEGSVWWLALISEQHLLILGVERYIAVSYPLRHATLLPIERIDKLILFAWISGACIGGIVRRITTAKMTDVQNKTTFVIIYTFHSSLVVLWMSMSILIICGNLLVMWVCIKRRMYENGVWRIQLSLSVVDFISGILSIQWYLTLNLFHGNSVLNVITSGSSWWMVFISEQHLMILAIERYVNVKYPLRHAQYLPNRRIDKLIVFAWGSGTCVAAWASYFFFFVERKIFYLSQTMYICFILFVLCALHFSVYKLAKNQERRIFSIRVIGENERANKNEMRATKTSIIIFSMFFVCFAPITVYYIHSTISYYRHQNDSIIFATVDLVLVGLLYANSFMNPLVYSVRNREFKREFKRILKI
ncbi:melanocortin receptor 5-like [Antedon mediterranea]|uniref:melanocortin receptor 5-like n=1 Tax=Antedon mediterranea TaxID=105859 RepID=UPI003AF6E309